MTTYWKSQPKKYCEICKCWYSDNPGSIAIHEKGEKHQDNLKRKIIKINEDKKTKLKEQKQYEKYMKHIEEAALRSFAKDIATTLKGDEAAPPVLGLDDNSAKETFKLPGSVKHKPKKTKCRNKGDKLSKDNFILPPTIHAAPQIGKWKAVSKEDSISTPQPPQKQNLLDLGIDLQLPKSHNVTKKEGFYDVVDQNAKNSESLDTDIAFVDSSALILFREKKMIEKINIPTNQSVALSTRFANNFEYANDKSYKKHQLEDSKTSNAHQDDAVFMKKRKKKFSERKSTHFDECDDI